MSAIYVVMASTGEYSDRVQWLVAAYASETPAQQHVELATEVADRIYAESEAAEIPCTVRNAASSPYDPHMLMWSGFGTQYRCVQVPLLTAVPTAPTVPTDFGRKVGAALAQGAR